MGTSVQDLVDWYDRGVNEEKAAYMIVVCDTFDYEDYPVYVSSSEVHSKIAHYNNSSQMSRVMEVYDLSLPFNKQKKQGGFAWSV